MRILNPTDLHRSKNNARGGAPLYNLNIYPLSLSGFYAVRGLQTIFFSCFQDDRFNHDIDALTGYRTKTLLCMPIKDTNGDVIGVAQVSTYNKKLKRTLLCGHFYYHVATVIKGQFIKMRIVLSVTFLLTVKCNYLVLSD
jgi:hypothetical protein